MNRFKILFEVRNNLHNMNREAAVDSLRNVLAVLGLGVLIGDFATMNPIYALPGALLLVAVWYADYLRHDLPLNAPTDESGGAQTQVDPARGLGRVS